MSSDALQLLVPRPQQPEKPLFIFLPGMDGAGTLLRSQIDRLVPWFDIRCLAISPLDMTGWEQLARQVIDLIASEKGLRVAQQAQMRTTGAGQRRAVYLCGESFGGCLAMQVLTFAPYLFERVILINPASSFRRLPWMQLGSLITRRLPDVVYRSGAQGLIPFLIEGHRVPLEDRQALESAMGEVPAQTAAWRMELLSRFEVEHLPLERMNHPVLLIAGGRDRLLPSVRETQRLQTRLPRARLKVLPKSGHACLLEKDTNLQKILRQQEFLASL